MHGRTLLCSAKQACRSLSTVAGIQTLRRHRSTLRLLAVGTAATAVVTGITAYASHTQQIAAAERNGEFMADPVSGTPDIRNKTDFRSQMEVLCLDLQVNFCRELERLEGGKKFFVEKWDKKQGGGGGGGITCVLQDGTFLEKGGCNISVVHGLLPASAAAQMRHRGHNFPEGKELPFFACGVSSVIHPRNPHIPTIHFNYRYFEVETAPGVHEWWYGGGTDLTPYFLDKDDVVHFHTTQKKSLSQHDFGRENYQKFKEWCDDYFLIKHRGMTRGVGGVFYDDVSSDNQEETFQFVKDASSAVLPSYIPIAEKNMNKAYTEADRQWQLIRRGQYVEFNLVYDRGTKFGLLTPGSRVESILMSLPLNAVWEYGHVPAQGSREAELVEVLKNPQNWV